MPYGITRPPCINTASAKCGYKINTIKCIIISIMFTIVIVVVLILILLLLLLPSSLLLLLLLLLIIIIIIMLFVVHDSEKNTIKLAEIRNKMEFFTFVLYYFSPVEVVVIFQYIHVSLSLLSRSYTCILYQCTHIWYECLPLWLCWQLSYMFYVLGPCFNIIQYNIIHVLSNM